MPQYPDDRGPVAVTIDPEHITTDQAADIVGVTPATFRVWAHRRGVKAVGHHRARGAGAAALWRAEDVYAATAHVDVVLLPKITGDTPRDGFGTRCGQSVARCVTSIPAAEVCPRAGDGGAVWGHGGQARRGESPPGSAVSGGDRDAPQAWQPMHSRSDVSAPVAQRRRVR